MISSPDVHADTWARCLALLSASGSSAASRHLEGARLLAYLPDEKTYQIEVPDPDSAEWLAERAAPQLTRYLCGLSNDWDLAIRFVTAQDSPPGGLPSFNIDSLEEEIAEPVSLALQRQGIREIVMTPERVISIPKYLLRWLPYTQPGLILLWIALYQIHYLKSAGKRSLDRQQPIATTYEEMARWSGLSLITVKRLFKDPQGMAWFLERGPNQYVSRGGKVCPQLSLRLQPLGLTPGDAHDLGGWLLAHRLIEDPESCLKQALASQPRDLLSYPLRLPQEGDPASAACAPGVHDLVLNLLGGNLPSVVLPLIEALSAHLGLSGSGDRFSTVSWYFMQKSVPLLGDSLAVLVLFCRSLTYQHAASGISRSDFWIKGGPDTIAALAQVKRDRVLDWFKPCRSGDGPLTERSAAELHNRAQKHAQLEQFISRLESRKTGPNQLDWRLHSTLIEPATPTDELAMQLAGQILSAARQAGQLSEIQAWAEKWAGCFDTHADPTLVDLILTSLPAGCFDTINGIWSGCFDTHAGDSTGCFETLLKILSEFKDTLQTNIPEEAPDTAPPPAAAGLSWMADLKEWDVTRLASLVKHRPRRQALLESDSGVPFMAHLLESCADPSVQMPLNLALTRLQDDPSGPGGAARRLAELPPSRLLELIRVTLEWGGEPDDLDWQSLFGGRPARVRLLAGVLGGG